MKAIFELDHAPLSCDTCELNQQNVCLAGGIKDVSKYTMNFSFQYDPLGKPIHVRRSPDCPLQFFPSAPEDDLKPCPFCGGKARMERVVGIEPGWKIVCLDRALCRAAIWGLKKSEAIAAWNRREQ
ncbi:MAG: Lar family restriction alleviation protein [Treponema sp.]|nr:Lar family restriction alleviation protein [Treponema sp.]